MHHINPWFPDAKFGVFIHWVLKATPMWNARAGQGVDDRQLARECAQEFTAAKFDAREWARLFKSWGARYAVLTTKHHIGFALFDHPDSPFTAKRNSPAGRDLVAEYCDALRDEGIKVGLYYSLPDWSHPDYPSVTGGNDPKKYSPTEKPEQWQRFVDHMFNEVRQLTSYKPDLLWFDGDWERSAEQWKSVELAAMIQQEAPNVVLNNRLRHECIGHYGSPEQNVPLGPPRGWWEMCMTPGDNWDGDAADHNIKPVHELIRIFGDVLGMGGNYLLNVAPDHEGVISDAQQSAMEGLGSWITRHAEAVYGTRAGLPAGLFNGASTHRGSVLYLITYDQPQHELVVKGLHSTPASVTLMTTGQPLEWRSSGGRAKFGHAGWLYIKLPTELMDKYASVVKITFENDDLEVRTPTGDTLRWKGRPDLTEQAVYEAR